MERFSLDTVCAALCYALNVPAPAQAAEAHPEICALVDRAFGSQKADRVFMYNPDAIAEWIRNKYTDHLREAEALAAVKVPLETVMPSVTPVCFGTMYTGAQPEVHGIRRYEKPVITIDTIFDALLRAGKKPAIIATENCSMSKIYLERDMDYFIFPTEDEANAKAEELIRADEHDFICVYNGNYDSFMHKNGPEAEITLEQLRKNSLAFQHLISLIGRQWKNHRTLAGFAMDHGCHEIDGGCGSHGLDMPEDLEILHYYLTI